MPPQSRSPLREKPLRNPGQSLDQQINDIIWDKILLYILMPVLITGLAGLEWWRTVHSTPPDPWPLTVLAVIAIGVSVWRVRSLLRDVRALAQGRDGEKVVGQGLEELRRSGCYIFHDIPGMRGNIDHAVVAPSGVYAIETKTYSKPVGRRDAHVQFDGTSLRVNGQERGAEILTQVKAERDDLRRRLKDLTGKDIPVRAVVVFPGWYIKPEGNWRTSGIWVLNHPGALLRFMDNERAVLRAEDVSLVQSSLATYIRQKSE